MKNYIYILVGDNDEIRYVGKTMYPKQRLYSHIKESKGVGNNHKINWIKKLLSEDKKPKMVLIDEVGEDWQYWERYWIEQFKQWGFNLTNQTEGGDGGNGYKHTEISKDKMRKSKLGTKLSEDQKKKISDSVKQKFIETPNYNKSSDKDIIISRDDLYQKYIIDNLSTTKCASHFNTSKATIFRNLKENNISKDKDVWKKQLSTNPKKIVLQYDLEGNLLKEWSSLSEIDLDTSNISNCCLGRALTAGGFIWRYKDKFIEIDLEKLNYQKRKIKQYDLKGNLIKSYNSIKEASYNGFNESNIQDCCVYRLKSHKGFIWRYIEDDSPVIYESKNKRFVLQYDLNDNFIKEWDSIVSASKELNIRSNNIVTCCSGKSKSSGGFIWKYK